MCLSPIHKWFAGRVAGERSNNVFYFGIQEEEESIRYFVSESGVHRQGMLIRTVI